MVPYGQPSELDLAVMMWIGILMMIGTLSGSVFAVSEIFGCNFFVATAWVVGVVALVAAPPFLFVSFRKKIAAKD